MSVYESRQAILSILDVNKPVDAPTVYYALDYPADRTELAVEKDAQGRAVGFVARCRTGLDLFRPLVTMRCFAPVVAARLLAQVLAPGHSYIFFARRDQLTLIKGLMEVQNTRILHVYRLDPKRFKPAINVMVQEKAAPDGLPRFEIYSGGLQAQAGINWQSGQFAEVFVYTEEEARRRGWGRSVITACTEQVLKAGQTPLYLVEADNEKSRQLARNVGYVDTGARQVYADVFYTGGHEA